MKLHIIHLNSRIDRQRLLDLELSTQNIIDYKIWPGIIESHPKKGSAKAQKIENYSVNSNIRLTISQILVRQQHKTAPNPPQKSSTYSRPSPQIIKTLVQQVFYYL